jgi:hypothetical protein
MYGVKAVSSLPAKQWGAPNGNNNYSSKTGNNYSAGPTPAPKSASAMAAIKGNGNG